VGQQDVGVAIATHAQRRTASHRDDLRANAGLLFEDQQQCAEQARIANARGGHEQQISFIGGSVGARDHRQQDGKQGYESQADHGGRGE
jgi:hypothetical protein